jgi:hypothetical protein
MKSLEIIENSFEENETFKEFIRNFCLHVKDCYFSILTVAKIYYYNIICLIKKHGPKTSGYLVSVLCINADLHYITFA